MFQRGSILTAAKDGEPAITVHPSLSRLAKPSADEVDRPGRRLGESRCYSQLPVTLTGAPSRLLADHALLLVLPRHDACPLIRAQGK